MRTLKKQLSILYAVAVVTFKEWAAYRTHSLVSLLIGPLYLLVQTAIWTAVYSTSGDLGGLSHSQMITYFGIVTLMGYLTMDFADWNLQMLIHTGRYLTYALRPMHHRFFAFSQKAGHRFLGFLIEFIPVTLLFWLLFDIALLPKEPLWAILSVGLSFLLVFYTNYLIGLTGFWLTRTGGLRRVLGLLTMVASGALIPLSLFPEAIQRVLFWLPFQYLTYVPAMVYMGEYQLGGVQVAIPVVVGIQAIYTLVMAGLTEIFYRLGNRRFMGVGV